MFLFIVGIDFWVKDSENTVRAFHYTDRASLSAHNTSTGPALSPFKIPTTPVIPAFVFISMPSDCKCKVAFLIEKIQERAGAP